MTTAPARAPFRLLMLSAMYENGGNLAHRLLDGHPGLFVYPFESQLGTRFVVDGLTSMFPLKYRWPEFALGASSQEDFDAIIDEEMRVRARTPHVSKFRHVAFEFSDETRKAAYLRYAAAQDRSRAHNVEAFFRATFDAWTNRRVSREEQVYVGYSPIVVVDGERMLADVPAGHLLHLVRNPWSAYADTKRRPVPLSLSEYMLRWTLNQHCATTLRRRHPDRVHILRTEDVMADPRAALSPVCAAVGVGPADALAVPTWNGEPLAQVAPWGTIRTATPAANRATALELSADERDHIRELAGPYLELFDYARFVG